MGTDPKDLVRLQANLRGAPIDMGGHGVSMVTIPGAVPSKSNCYRMGKTRSGQPIMYKTQALTAYEENFFIHCPLRDRKLKGYFELRLDVFYPSERADLDNSLKIILDCLQACRAIVNDRKCVLIVARKFKDAACPRIEFTITALQEQ